MKEFGEIQGLWTFTWSMHNATCKHWEFKSSILEASSRGGIVIEKQNGISLL